MLKAVVFELPKPPVNEYIIDEKKFKKISKQLTNVMRDELQSAGVDGTDIQSMTGKLKELNRSSFKRILHAIFQSIEFSPSEAETNLFVKCRNSLVHAGRFCDLKPEEHELLYCMPQMPDELKQVEDDTAALQYFFLEYFVDRVILKVLGYSGPFNDVRMHSPGYRQPGNPGNLA